MKKTAVIMGSDSDLAVMQGAIYQLRAFDMPFEVRVISAHRTPEAAAAFAKNAVEDDFGVIIAAAGKAAHLGGVLAAHTALPVIGVPIQTSMMGGLDSLLSMVQMPSGVPVATVGVNAAANAAILAAEILALEDPALTARLEAFRADMADTVAKKDAAISEQFRQ